MSISFKSMHPQNDNQKLVISGAIGGVHISVDHGSNGAKGIFIPTNDAPSIGLAILESAGFKDSSSGGHITGARIAVGDLKRHVAKQERESAKAKEQAELETCALEMLNALRKHHGKPERSWEDTHVEVREEFLVLARRARELGGMTKK